MNILDDANVYLVKLSNGEIKYPSFPPYSPFEKYPEYKFDSYSDEPNYVYPAIRNLFYLMGLDKENFNTSNWNPLGKFIKPGESVVLKPNWVTHYNHAGYSLDCVITHGSVIRAVMDYVAIALQGKGRIIIFDAPIQGTNWEKLLEIFGWREIKKLYEAKYPDIKLDIVDGRLGKALIIAKSIVRRFADENRISDYYEIDIGTDSLLVPLMNNNCEFGVIQYPKYRMQRAHTIEHNKYLIHKLTLDADVFINLPKFKSHQKAGITCALKNLVGIVGHKDYLPHFRYGSPKNGGDEYPDGNFMWDLMWYFEHKDWDLDKGIRKLIYHNMFRFLAFIQWAFGLKPRGFTRIGGGSWYGNDTLWRTVLDLNRIFFYYDTKNQSMSNKVQRRYLCIIDGLIGGHKESPLAPTPINCGFLVSGINPAAIDLVCATLMGFDFEKIKLVKNAFEQFKYPLIRKRYDEVNIHIFDDGNVRENLKLEDLYNYIIKFEPSIGFKGYIEKVFK